MYVLYSTVETWAVEVLGDGGQRARAKGERAGGGGSPSRGDLKRWIVDCCHVRAIASSIASL